MGDLYSLIQYLMQTQNRRLVQPELAPGQQNYNQTPGNPAVALEDGWLRSLMPYYTGDGLPGGQGNDDGKARSLQELMWMRNPGLMKGYEKERKSNAEAGKMDLNTMIQKMMLRPQYKQPLL